MPPRVPLLPRNDLKALLQAYLQRANQPPHDGSLPLFIAGYRCGWLFPPIAVDLKRTTGVEISATNDATAARVTTTTTVSGSTMFRRFQDRVFDVPVGKIRLYVDKNVVMQAR